MEKCLKGYCRSPVACAGFGNCRERNFLTKEVRLEPGWLIKDGMFVLHNCWKCKDGREACVAGNPHQCGYLHARR